MPDFRRRGSWLVALLTVVAIPPALAQGSTVDEIAKYRAALQDGNPAELWEARGEELWKQKRGPRQVSLEQCDLGLGAGVVKGAYARLPRYFADADRVMDLETRLVWCMVAQQGYTEADAKKSPFGSGNAKLKQQKECRNRIGTRRISDVDYRRDSSRPHLLTARTHGGVVTFT